MKALSLAGECAEKSELIGRLVGGLVGRGLQVSTIKRVSDAVDLERQGSGTWKHRAASAAEVMIASASRLALLREMPPDTTEPEVSDLLARMAPVDIVLLDGVRRSNYPKRKSCGLDRVTRCRPQVIRRAAVCFFLRIECHEHYDESRPELRHLTQRCGNRGDKPEIIDILKPIDCATPEGARLAMRLVHYKIDFSTSNAFLPQAGHACADGRKGSQAGSSWGRSGGDARSLAMAY